MSHLPSRSVLIPGLLIFLVLGFTRGGESTRVLATEASLRAGPGSASLSGLLTAGTPVVVLAERDGWMQVRIEGWVQANALTPAATAPVVAPTPAPAGSGSASAPSTTPAAADTTAPVTATTPPATRQPTAMTTPPPTAAKQPTAMATPPSTAAAPATPPAPAPVVSSPAATPPPSTAAALARIEGSIAVEMPGFFKRKKDTTGSGVLVLLLPDGFEVDPSINDDILALDAEAAQLKRKADKAMRAPSLSTATQERDRYMGERSDLLDQRWDYMMQIHGRNEARARTAAVQTAVADSNGWYTFASVPPGSYTLYARWIKNDLDLEWFSRVAVEQMPVRIDLDESSAIGFPAQ